MKETREELLNKCKDLYEKILYTGQELICYDHIDLSLLSFKQLVDCRNSFVIKTNEYAKYDNELKNSGIILKTITLSENVFRKVALCATLCTLVGSTVMAVIAKILNIDALTSSISIPSSGIIVGLVGALIYKKILSQDHEPFEYIKDCICLNEIINEQTEIIEHKISTEIENKKNLKIPTK